MPRSQSKESTRAYFRRLFGANPDLVWERSNQPLLDQWKRDHNRQDVPANIKLSLSGTKSELRAELRAAGREEAARPPRTGRGGGLEQLEEAIDSCLQLARQHESDEMLSIIKQLRRARNRVVLELGEMGNG
jgi:hypothetical protein